VVAFDLFGAAALRESCLVPSCFRHNCWM
jgi:hypothetical protein